LSTSARPVNVPFQNEASEFPVELEGAIGRLECDGIEVEERGDYFMLTIRQARIRCLLWRSGTLTVLNVVQVNFIDRVKGIYDNIMPE